jgi:polyisoprenyl-teichoic acid--peptidoglycan teichoic acid transferase
MYDPQPDNEQTVPHGQNIPQNIPTEPSIPKVTPPLYSTSDYSSRRTTPPPPPPNYRDSAARDRARKRRTNGTTSGGEWAWVIVAATLFGVIIVVSLGAVVLIRANQTPQEIIPTADVIASLPTPVIVNNDLSNIVLGDALVMADGSSIKLTPWDGQSRFTMVMVGLDRRPGETGLAYRTDTMMLVSIDPVAKSIGVLSIPRDLYVQVPGYAALQRVNSPMVFGETSRPGGGPILMMQTVQLNLGMRVNDYVAVDFQAFIDVVNAIGGITVTTDYTINDPQYPNMNYGYDPFYLPAGTHLLDGYNALRFARTRHGDSDIQRAERQQATLLAVRDKLLNANMLPSFIAQAPSLWQSLSDNVYTGLTFEQMVQLGLYMKDIPLESIQLGVINYEYLIPYTTEDGASVLIPNRAKLGTLMVNTFGASYSQ